MRLIPLSGKRGEGLGTKVDDDIYHRYGHLKWYRNDMGYAVRRVRTTDGKKVTIRLHRLVVTAPPGMVVDHINRKKLDNRRLNLRVVTQRENAQNGLGRWGQRVYLHLPQGITFDKAREKYMVKKPSTKRFNTLEEAVAYRGTI
jgi:hypothetical protein